VVIEARRVSKGESARLRPGFRRRPFRPAAFDVRKRGEMGRFSLAPFAHSFANFAVKKEI